MELWSYGDALDVWSAGTPGRRGDVEAWRCGALEARCRRVDMEV